MMALRLRAAIIAATLLAASAAFAAPETPLLDTMDEMTFTLPAGKGSVEPVEGRTGRAIRFSFSDNCQSVFAPGRARGAAEWDKAVGISFWVKGDGSKHLGGLEFVWNDDYSWRYAFAFPIDSTEWRKIIVPWRDLIPEVATMTKPISPVNGNAPSRLNPIQFGKWWYWKDYAAHSYTIDDIRLEEKIPADNGTYRPSGAPLTRVLKKLAAHQPVTIVTMGDSLTDTAHWSNRESCWPAFLQAKLKAKYGSEVTLVNPAMGGTELRQNLVVMPRWLAEAPAPDLVTVFFGGNDYNSGMRGPNFTEAQKDAIDRIRRATKGRADVLVLSTCPSLDNAPAIAELAEACRAAAKDRSAGLADVYAAFTKPAQPDRAALFAWDKVHLSPVGQQLVADTVLAAIAGK